MLHRLRKDFRLSLIILLGVCGIVGLGPFAIYRLISEQWLMAALDGLLVTAILLAILYVWRTGDTRRTGIFLAVVNTGMAVTVTHLTGLFGLFWLYVVMLSNYFIAPVKVAALATVVALSTVVVVGTHLESPAETASFLITAAITSLFAYIFSTRSEMLRLQMERLATIDPLTGAGNRLALESELEIAIAALERHGQNHGLLMLDLDHFKTVNDTHGHATGDRILRNFTRLVAEYTRREDRLFRFGGEEFVLLVSDCDELGLHRAAQHLRQSIHEHLECPSGPVTVSIGGALLRPGESWETWLKRADKALYQAKQQGRNQAVMAQAAVLH
ncbi:MAG: GGDEF domain-containing protein [Oleiphilaceae bacterium]|nr:GGDEF domain-containing protein [Oleiphilaceae bacterium]